MNFNPSRKQYSKTATKKFHNKAKKTKLISITYTSVRLRRPYFFEGLKSAAWSSGQNVVLMINMDSVR